MQKQVLRILLMALFLVNYSAARWQNYFYRSCAREIIFNGYMYVCTGSKIICFHSKNVVYKYKVSVQLNNIASIIR